MSDLQAHVAAGDLSPKQAALLAMQQTAAALERRLATCHERTFCPACGAVLGDRCHRKGALYIPGYDGYGKPAWLKHPHRERWEQETPAR